MKVDSINQQDLSSQGSNESDNKAIHNKLNNANMRNDMWIDSVSSHNSSLRENEIAEVIHALESKSSHTINIDCFTANTARNDKGHNNNPHNDEKRYSRNDGMLDSSNNMKPDSINPQSLAPTNKHLDSIIKQLDINPYTDTNSIFDTLDSTNKDNLNSALFTILKDKNVIFSKFINAHRHFESYFLSSCLAHYGISRLISNRGVLFSIMQTNQILLPHIIFANNIILQEPISKDRQERLLENLTDIYGIYLSTKQFLLEVNFCLGLKHYLQENDLQDSLLIRLISLAIFYNASDIHIVASGGVGKVYMRIDGNLLHFTDFNLALFDKISQKIKMLCGLDINERRMPQDGQFCFNDLDNIESFFHIIDFDDYGISKDILNKKYDIRVSCCPALKYESIVLRIQHHTQQFLDLDSMQLQKEVKEKLESSLLSKSGLVIISGPTGSGKSTMLYNCLRFINNDLKKIVTIEDPIEQEIVGITQCQINEEAGLGFSIFLKHILRQDPDVIMVGEIRDSNTMESALRAALTGHLVLSSLHSSSCISSIARLRDLGAKEYVLESTLSCIISQRLLRTYCPYCKYIEDNIVKNHGCPKCYYHGFGRRMLVQEAFDRVGISAYLNNENIPPYLSLKEQANKLFVDKIISYEESLV